jgi:hypothetical protein
MAFAAMQDSNRTLMLFDECLLSFLSFLIVTPKVKIAGTGKSLLLASVKN